MVHIDTESPHAPASGAARAAVRKWALRAPSTEHTVTYPDGSEPQSDSHNHSGQDSPLHSWHGRAAPMAPVDAESPPAPRFRVDTALDHEVGPNGSQFAEGGNHERGTP